MSHFLKLCIWSSSKIWIRHIFELPKRELHFFNIETSNMKVKRHLFCKFIIRRWDMRIHKRRLHYCAFIWLCPKNAHKSMSLDLQVLWNWGWGRSGTAWSHGRTTRPLKGETLVLLFSCSSLNRSTWRTCKVENMEALDQSVTWEIQQTTTDTGLLQCR
jgi:hypothetical protein